MTDTSTFVLPPPPSVSPPPEPARRSRSRVAIALIAALAVASAVAVVVLRGGGRAEAVPLAFSFAEGDREAYRVSISIDAELAADGFGGELDAFEGMPFSMRMAQTVAWEVLSVDEEGVATIEVRTTDVSGSVNGIDLPAGQADHPPIEMRVAPDGRILSIGDLSLAGLEQGGLPGEGGLPGMSQLTPILPEDGAPVAPGDEWDTSYSQDLPFGEGAIEYDVHGTYLRNEEVDGRDAAVIASEVRVPLDVVFRLSEVVDLFAGSELGADLGGPRGPSDAELDELRAARISYEGSVDQEMTSWVDIAAEDLLRSDSSGAFDLTIAFAGLPGFEGSMRLDGTYTQSLEVA